MNGSQLLKYMIDISDVLPEKKREATEYLTDLEEVAKSNVDFRLLLKDLAAVKTAMGEDTEKAEELLDCIINEIGIKALKG
jgi:hypothetical protein